MSHSGTSDAADRARGYAFPAGTVTAIATGQSSTASDCSPGLAVSLQVSPPYSGDGDMEDGLVPSCDMKGQ